VLGTLAIVISIVFILMNTLGVAGWLGAVFSPPHNGFGTLNLPPNFAPVLFGKVLEDNPDIKTVVELSPRGQFPEMAVQNDKAAVQALGLEWLGVEYFDPDFVWNTAHNGWHFKGSPFQGIQATWDRVFSVGIGRDLDVATYRVEPYAIFDAGPDTVIVLAHYCGNSVRSGKPHRIQVAHLWTLKNGRIKQFKQYTDTYHMMHFDEYDA